MATQDHDEPEKHHHLPHFEDPGIAPPFEPESFADEAERHYSTDKIVFGVAAVLVVAFLAWGLFATDSLSSVATSVLNGVIHSGGWGFVLAASFFVVFAIWLAISKYGRIPLGKDDETPEFKTISWIAMMFSAGMGIGLMFYGVGEPLSHFASPPPGTVEAGTPEAFDTAMATTLFHWTLHPWAIYAVVGLAIAYSTFRKGRRQLISSTFVPLLGRRGPEGGFGRAIDILAIFATLFGSAASLGLGALQIGGGLVAGGFIDSFGTNLLVIIIVVLSICFIVSAVSGVSKGIQWLSNINMVLAAVLAAVVFIGGPTIVILNLIPTMIGDYFGDLAQMASRTAATGGMPRRPGCPGGRSSTGRGGSPGPRSSACSSPGSAAGARSVGSSPVSSSFRARSAWCGSASSGAPRSRPSKTVRTWPGRRWRVSCSACWTPCRWAASWAFSR